MRFTGAYFNLIIKCGAAGSRTLVQTRNEYAFYMLSWLLIFESRLEINIRP